MVRGLGIMCAAFASVACSLAACRGAKSHQPSTASGAPSSADPGVVHAAVAPSLPPPPAPPATERWPDWVRRGEMKEAARVIDALPPARLKSPEVRYVRA